MRFPAKRENFLFTLYKIYVTAGNFTRCRAKFMTCEIHDYRGSAHVHVMRMIAFASYISQLDNNNTRASGFGHSLASEIETNSSAKIT